MRLLTLDAALGACTVGLVADGVVEIAHSRVAATGQAETLAILLAEVLAAAPGGPIAAVAVTLGPGSFTGIRAGLALAEGLALARACPVIGLSLGEALEATLTRAPGWRPGWAIWSAIDSRRGRIFLEHAGQVVALAPGALPLPGEPVALAGDAAALVAAHLAARGAQVMLTDVRRPDCAGIAAAAAARQTGRLPPRTALPLYVDPPAVRLPVRAPAAPVADLPADPG